jgi:hypothetical protein
MSIEGPPQFESEDIHDEAEHGPMGPGVGPLRELLDMSFIESQRQEFESAILEPAHLTLESLDKLSQVEAQEVIDLLTTFFNTKTLDEKNALAGQITGKILKGQ